jgi:heterodisulfide reductase subunit C
MNNHHGNATVGDSLPAVSACYQCGKCSAGCPVAERMDLLPHQLLRLAQLGRWEKALRSAAIWECVSCLTCSARCPQGVDCAGVIDTLRQRSVQEDVVSPVHHRTVLFQKAFLDNIRRNGRLAELELIGVFKTGSFLHDMNVPMLLKDSLLAPALMRRHKFHFLPKRVRDRDLVRRIFDRCTNAHS